MKTIARVAFFNKHQTTSQTRYSPGRAQERKDAQIRIEAIMQEAAALAQAQSEARARYEHALAALSALIDGAYRPTNELTLLKDEVAYLCQVYGCERIGTFPTLTQPEPVGLKELYTRAAMHYEQQFDFSNKWKSALGEWLRQQSEKIAHARREERRRQSALAGWRARRGLLRLFTPASTDKKGVASDGHATHAVFEPPSGS